PSLCPYTTLFRSVLSKISSPFLIKFSANVLSLMSLAFIFTLKKAPATAAFAHIIPTAPSDREDAKPDRIISCITSIDSYAVFITLNGTSAAYFVAFSIASALNCFSSSVSFGILNPSIILLKALVSSSTKFNKVVLYCCPLTAQSEKNSHLSSQPLLCPDRLATIVPKATPSVPT